jgi:two-component system, chemotaxis family, protein-glutamate methylesterase/glutaminase
MSQAAIRVLVVDDSALYRQMLLNVLGRIPEVDVVGVAEDGNQAVEMVASLHPDVLTLDVQMPGLDGIGVLRALRERGLSSRAIMVSSLTQEGAPAATAAIFEGAFDVIAKPAGLPPHEAREFLSRQLVEKIAVVRAASEPSKGPAGNGPAGNGPAGVARRRADKPVAVDVVAIASSTGGPPVLREILSALPADFPAAVLVVQHMPPVFTSSLAARLDTVCPLRVVEAADHMLVEPGTVLIAPGGVHLSVRRRGDAVRTLLDDAAPRHGCRPSFDVLGPSLVEAYGSRCVAVVLTGMGCDGLEACRALKARGGTVLAQTAETCAVFGMPKCVIEAGLADGVLPPEGVAMALVSMARKRHA